MRTLLGMGLRYVLPARAYWRVLAWRIGCFDPELRLLRHLIESPSR